MVCNHSYHNGLNEKDMGQDSRDNPSKTVPVFYCTVIYHSAIPISWDMTGGPSFPCLARSLFCSQAIKNSESALRWQQDLFLPQ